MPAVYASGTGTTSRRRAKRLKSWICRHTERGLLALADAGCICFWNGNHKPQTVEIFDLDNRLGAGSSGRRSHQRARMKVSQRDHSVKRGANFEIRLKLLHAAQRILRSPDI